MLVKRFIGEIHFLPALFLEFKTGKIKGVQVRGGYTVDMEWKNSELVQATIFGKTNTLPAVRLKEEIADPKNDNRLEVDLGI